jgi:hypothetical protein
MTLLIDTNIMIPPGALSYNGITRITIFTINTVATLGQWGRAHFRRMESYI